MQYDEVLLAIVDGLQRSSGSNVDDAAHGSLVALWRIAEKHRRRPARTTKVSSCSSCT